MYLSMYRYHTGWCWRSCRTIRSNALLLLFAIPSSSLAFSLPRLFCTISTVQQFPSACWSTTTTTKMPKRKWSTNLQASGAHSPPPPPSSSSVNQTCAAYHFRETSAREASRLTDGVKLTTANHHHSGNTNSKVIMPWMGFGTYRLGKEQAEAAVLQAIKCGYRAIDTAFIYGGEATEKLVGQAIQKALNEGIISSRAELFVTTKHWRKYHGYEPTLKCIGMSLKRLQLPYVDLWLMHWPGPAWSTMNRLKSVQALDPWHYAATTPENMAAQRAETWRGMEEALRRGLCRSIGVSNFSVAHLETLKTTAVVWPPAVNQVEFHPLYPQIELLQYCREEGILLQAYASLGGQDTGKKAWSQLLGTANDGKTLDLLGSEPVQKLAAQMTVDGGGDGAQAVAIITPALVLLRWALEQGVALIPKTVTEARLVENAGVFDCSTMSQRQVDGLRDELLAMVRANNHPDHRPASSNNANDNNELTRLCWRSDPLRHLNFD